MFLSVVSEKVFMPHSGWDVMGSSCVSCDAPHSSPVTDRHAACQGRTDLSVILKWPRQRHWYSRCLLSSSSVSIALKRWTAHTVELVVSSWTITHTWIVDCLKHLNAFSLVILLCCFDRKYVSLDLFHPVETWGRGGIGNKGELEKASALI